MRIQIWVEDSNPLFLIFMKFVLKEDDSIKKLISKIRKVKSSGIKNIAERDMLISILLFNLEEKSNYFSLCKSVLISPYGIISKKLLLNAVEGNFVEEVEKGLKKIEKKERVHMKSPSYYSFTRDLSYISERNKKKQEFFKGVFAFVKFVRKIKRNYISDSAYIENEKEIKLTKEEQQKVSKIINLILMKDKKVSELIEEAFILYYAALKEKDNAFSFLRFWIVIEMLIKSGSKLNNEEIIKRATSIYNNDLYGSLKLLYKKRNKIVHSYVFVSQDERNLLKSIAETTIAFVLSNLKGIKNLEDVRKQFENAKKKNEK